MCWSVAGNCIDSREPHRRHVLWSALCVTGLPADYSFARIQQLINPANESHRAYQRERSDSSLRERFLNAARRSQESPSLCDHIVDEDDAFEWQRRVLDGK